MQNYKRANVFTIIFINLFIYSCSGVNDDEINEEPTLAESLLLTSDSLAENDDQESIFISRIDIDVDPELVRNVSFTIKNKSEAVSDEISVDFPKSFVSNGSSIVLPIFGLYENHDNIVLVNIVFNDLSSTQIEKVISTPPFDDPGQFNKNVFLRQLPNVAKKPSFSFFLIKPNTSPLEQRNDLSFSPIIVDIDGNIRWVRNIPDENSPLYKINRAAKFHDGKIIGWHINADSPTMLIMDLIGGVELIEIKNSQYILDNNFIPHHDIRFGKSGYLIEVDVTDTVNGDLLDINGQVLIEVNDQGEIINEFDFGKILSDHMLENNDNPSNFNRSPINWFHGNSSIYDQTDNSIITSSRENFVMKVGYDDKKIKWIFGDPTKHWYVNFPSLQALALSTDSDYPTGQHSLSMEGDSLMLFNNGLPSFRNPDNTPSGEPLSSSKTSKYLINENDMVAERVWNYDPGIYSGVCSSIFRDDEGDYLINYSAVDFELGAGAAQQIENLFMGINDEKEILFEFSITTLPCATSWNTDIVDLSRIEFN